MLADERSLLRYVGVDVFWGGGRWAAWCRRSERSNRGLRELAQISEQNKKMDWVMDGRGW